MDTREAKPEETEKDNLEKERRQASKSVDLSFLEVRREDSDKSSIIQPGERKLSLLSRLRRLNLIYIIIVGFLVIVIVIVVVTSRPLVEEEANINAEDNSLAAQVDNSDNSSESLFSTEVFYKVEFADERDFYAHIEAVDLEHYKLTDIFYTATSTDVSRITLVKYGTEADQPKDEMFVPRERVQIITPLQKTSPIVEAIEKYLTDN